MQLYAHRGSPRLIWELLVARDTNIQSQWQSLRNHLIESGYDTIPTTPQSEGTIIHQEGRPVVGLWLMPDNTIPGMLEDFMSWLIPAGDILWPMAQDIVQQVYDLMFRLPKFRPN